MTKQLKKSKMQQIFKHRADKQLKPYDKKTMKRASQADKERLDLNNLIKQYTIRDFQQINQNLNYGEFKNFNYSEMVDKSLRLEQLMQELPADIRLSFQNDPQELINFLDNATPEEMVERGLLDASDIKKNTKDKVEDLKKDETKQKIKNDDKE